MKKLIISGYAAVFGSQYDMGSYSEVVAHGALDGVDFSECRALFNHDVNYLLGSVRSKTLEVRADSKGLFYRCTLPDSPTGNEVAELLKRGDLCESSWGFVIAEKSWSRDGTLLTIHKIKKLFDVSPVTYPANPATTATLETIFHPKPAETTTDDTRSEIRQLTDEVMFLRRQQIYLTDQITIEK